jgi:hypothetical protein
MATLLYGPRGLRIPLAKLSLKICRLQRRIVTIKQKQKETYGNLNKIRNSLNFQLAKHSGGILYRN